MSLTCIWQFGIDSDEWRTRVQAAVRKFRVPATVWSRAESLLRLPANPLHRYVIETDDIIRAFEIAVQIARKWWVQGIGHPIIGLVTSGEVMEKAGFGVFMPLGCNPSSLFELKIPKEYFDSPPPLDRFELFSRFTSIDTRVLQLYHLANGSVLSELLPRLAQGCGLQYFSVPSPYDPLVSDEHIIVIEQSQLGEFIMSGHEIVWRGGLWRKPLGLVAVADKSLHSDLLSVRLEGRPLFMDVCTVDQLAVEGTARVCRWRTDLETALRKFYALWER